MPDDAPPPRRQCEVASLGGRASRARTPRQRASFPGLARNAVQQRLFARNCPVAGRGIARCRVLERITSQVALRSLGQQFRSPRFRMRFGREARIRVVALGALHSRVRPFCCCPGDACNQGPGGGRQRRRQTVPGRRHIRQQLGHQARGGSASQARRRQGRGGPRARRAQGPEVRPRRSPQLRARGHRAPGCVVVGGEGRLGRGAAKFTDGLTDVLEGYAPGARSSDGRRSVRHEESAHYQVQFLRMNRVREQPLCSESARLLLVGVGMGEATQRDGSHGRTEALAPPARYRADRLFWEGPQCAADAGR